MNISNRRVITVSRFTVHTRHRDPKRIFLLPSWGGGGSGISLKVANPKEGANILFANFFSRKLHENEEYWTERGCASPKFYYVDPPLAVANSGAIKQLMTKIGQFENTCKSLGCLCHFTVTSSVTKKNHQNNALLFVRVQNGSRFFETFRNTKKPNVPNSSRLLHNDAVLKEIVQ